MLLKVCLLLTLRLLTPDSAVADPGTLYWDGAHLASLRSAREKPDDVARALAEMQRDAEAALARGPYSVVDKDVVPPSGDKHDYLSYSRYWWPNPDTDDGLPYVRRDGVVNRELLAKGDRVTIGAFYDDVESLALAAYLVDDQRYAPHASRLIHAWFIAPATRMNPHLKYGQGVPGRAVGRGVGLIDTRHFIRVLDSVALLNEVGAIDAADNEALKTWFDQYLDWMLTSDLGADERSANNNHGSWFAAQASYLALYVGRTGLAAEIVSEVNEQRIPESILANGSQPAELRRTRSLHYSLFNLAALTVVSRMGDHVGIDLWGAPDGDSSQMRRALDFVTPFVTEPSNWPHPEFDNFRLSDRQKHPFMIASRHFRTPRYAAAAAQAPARREDRRYSVLMFPALDRGGRRE